MIEFKKSYSLLYDNNKMLLDQYVMSWSDYYSGEGDDNYGIQIILPHINDIYPLNGDYRLDNISAQSLKIKLFGKKENNPLLQLCVVTYEYHNIDDNINNYEEKKQEIINECKNYKYSRYELLDFE